MADRTAIEWTATANPDGSVTKGATWNPTRGCTRISPGCGGPNHEGGCYAEKIAARFSDPGQPYHGFAERTKHGGRWTGKVALVENALDLPLRWKKPRKIFVNSMSDWAHEALTFRDMARIIEVAREAPQHDYLLLTKRAERQRDFAQWWCMQHAEPRLPWNCWLGTSIEDRERLTRLDALRQTPARIRFVSAEPLLEDLGSIDLSGISWTIVGSESGPHARLCDLDWVRNIRDQCVAADIPFFWKQHAVNGRKISLPALDGKQWSQHP